MFAKVGYFLLLLVLSCLLLSGSMFASSAKQIPDPAANSATATSDIPVPGTDSFGDAEPISAQLPTSSATPSLASANPGPTLFPTAPATPISFIYLPAIVFEEVIIPTPTSVPVNLAPNPSFEEGIDSPFSWASGIQYGATSFAWDDTISRSGSRALKIFNTIPGSCNGNPSPQCASGEWITVESIPIDPTHDYLISAWYRNESQSNRTSFLAIMWGEDPYALGSTGLWRLAPNNEWTYRTYVIEASIFQEHFPGVNRVQLMFGHFSENTDSGGVWIDDVSFVDLTLHPNYPR